MNTLANSTHLALIAQLSESTFIMVLGRDDKSKVVLSGQAAW